MPLASESSLNVHNELYVKEEGKGGRLGWSRSRGPGGGKGKEEGCAVKAVEGIGARLCGALLPSSPFATRLARWVTALAVARRYNKIVFANCSGLKVDSLQACYSQAPSLWKVYDLFIFAPMGMVGGTPPP